MILKMYMKKFCIAFILVLFASSALDSVGAFSAPRQDVTLMPDISEPYNAVSVEGEFRVIYGESSDTLRIVANDRVIQRVECVVENSTLTVRYAEGESVRAIIGGKSPIVYLPANSDISKISLLGSTRLECASAIVQDSLSFEMSGAARVIGEVNSTKLDIHCAGAVNMTLTGSSDEVHIRIDGASRVALGEGFQCREAELDVNGAGLVRISCSEKIYGDISGTSIVKYLGDPQISVRTNGLAGISSMN